MTRSPMAARLIALAHAQTCACHDHVVETYRLRNRITRERATAEKRVRERRKETA